jgi:hypothetical protein
VLLIRLIPPNRSYTSVFIEEGDWTLYKLISRANSANLANNRSTKLGTLIYSAYARTVQIADRLASGPNHPAAQFGAQLKVPFDPGTGSGCRLEGGVNRRIKLITLKLKFLLYWKT